MATECSKRWTIDERDRRYLWASSAGYCANPDCRVNLFALLDDAHVSFGELAHIFAAGDLGPRSNPLLSPKQRAESSNIVLLCANCHTIVDKAPNSFPANTITSWKRDHLDAISSVFEVPRFHRREDARHAVQGLFSQNRSVFLRYGPKSTVGQERFDGEPVSQWRRKVQEIILPNNRRILHISDTNSVLLTAEEREVVETFRNHLDDFEARHYNAAVEPGGEQFPEQIEGIFA
jgi:hypothetical protein